MTTKPTVIARRWDGAGARLHAILNAWSIARALDLDFRFIWPRGVSFGLDEPDELFGRGFLDRFETSGSACEGKNWIGLQPPNVSAGEARDQCRSAQPGALIEISECFRILAFRDESPEVARQRFLRDFLAIEWSPEIAALTNDIDGWSEGRSYCAMHIRAGDIVFGDWRQFLPIAKYLPVAYVEIAIKSLAPTCQLLLVSDNVDYVSYLKERFDSVSVPEDIVTHYRSLSESQKMFADILLLARARRLFGPPMSAFSRLAADLGAADVCRVDEWMSDIEAESGLRCGVARPKSAFRRPRALSPLGARDICWYLDTSSDNIGARRRLALAKCAVSLDPDYCGAFNRWALSLAMSGRHEAAEKAVARALSIAATAKIHQDPLVESLATAIATKALACVTHRQADRTIFVYIDPTVSKFRIVHEDLRLKSMKRDLAQCEALVPYQIQMGDVLLNLRYLVAAVEWLATADVLSRQIVRTCLVAEEAGEFQTSSWRISGKELLAGSEEFPQVLRNIEFVTIRFARAIGAAIASNSRPSLPEAFHVDAFNRSPSGLSWITGWAHKPILSRNGPAIGLAFNGNLLSGGPMFLPRLDAAESRDSPRGEISGFTFPVPIDHGRSEGAAAPPVLMVAS